MAGGVPALREIGLQVGRGIRPMLASPAADIDVAMEKLSPAAVEWKLDGIRAQVHRDGSDVAVFSRTLDDITERVPGIVEAALALPVRSVVLDGEAIALRDDGRPHAFQDTASRGHRLQALYFDVLHLDGEDVLDEPGAARAERLAAVVPEALRVPRRVAADAEAAGAVLDDALAMGHEGVIVKSLDAPYAAGRRGAGWLKVKPVHTLDLVILAAEWGHGRRRGWLSNLHLGARHDTEPGQFVMLGKTFKGLTDKMLQWQTEAAARARHRPRRLGRPRPPRARRRDRVRRHPAQHALPGRRRPALRARAAPPPRQARRGGRHARVGAGRRRGLSARHRRPRAALGMRLPRRSPRIVATLSAGWESICPRSVTRTENFGRVLRPTYLSLYKTW